jgi:hypothetical protein
VCVCVCVCVMNKVTLQQVALRVLLFSPVYSCSSNFTITRCTEYTRWFKYDRDDLCVSKSQFTPVIFEPPCMYLMILPLLIYTYDLPKFAFCHYQLTENSQFHITIKLHLLYTARYSKLKDSLHCTCTIFNILLYLCFILFDLCVVFLMIICERLKHFGQIMFYNVELHIAILCIWLVILNFFCRTMHGMSNIKFITPPPPHTKTHSFCITAV